MEFSVKNVTYDNIKYPKIAKCHPFSVKYILENNMRTEKCGQIDPHPYLLYNPSLAIC